MPQRQVKFEGRTYTVPNDASDDEVFSFLDSQSKPTPPPGAATPRAGVGQRGMAPPPSPFQATSEQAFRQGMGQRQQQLGIQAPSSATAFTPEGGWGDLGRTALRTGGAGSSVTRDRYGRTRRRDRRRTLSDHPAHHGWAGRTTDLRRSSAWSRRWRSRRRYAGSGWSGDQ